MDFTAEQYEMARQHLQAQTIGREAPIIVLGMLLQLVGVGIPVASLCQFRDTREDGEPLTTWRAAWLTETHLLYVDAAKHIDSWNSSDINEDDAVPDQLEAWSRPLREVAVQQIADANVGRPADAKDFKWDFVYEVVFSDGAVVTLPLFGEYSDSHQEREAVATFWSQLRETS